MAMADYGVRERLTKLWQLIENTHFGYLETDESPEKLQQRKKLEGHILDYLRLVPHESKFLLRETGEVFSGSAVRDPDFSGYRFARGWTALARYAGNLFAQPWRKEYTTVRLYSGYYKHEVQGSGLHNAEAILRAMGYRPESDTRTPCDTFVLDGPVCPDLVVAVSRDSLIAYVECQIMIQIWEEISMRGGTCSWSDIMRCREAYSGDVEQGVSMLLHVQRTGDDIYCNVKFPAASQIHTKGSRPLVQNNVIPSNGHIGHATNFPIRNDQLDGVSHLIDSSIYSNGQEINYPSKNNGIQGGNFINLNNHRDPRSAYCQNVVHNGYNLNGVIANPMHQMNNYGGPSNYYYAPTAGHPYTVPYMNHVNNLPLANNYNCVGTDRLSYCSNIPTARLIEIEPSNYAPEKHCCPNLPISPEHNHLYLNGKDKNDLSYSSKDYHMRTHHDTQFSRATNKKSFDPDLENYENNRRNSAPRSSATNSNDYAPYSLPRSDTQPSLSRAREDGTGTFESWDYVYRKLESQPESAGDLINVPSSSYDRESKTLGRMGNKEFKKYMPATLDLEDALRIMTLEKNSEEEVFRAAKINEALMKKKQESEAKAAKREKRKSGMHDTVADNVVCDPIKITDKTRLISKEDYKCKREMDKEIQIAHRDNNSLGDNRKNKKSLVKCLSSEVDKSLKRKTTENGSVASARKNHTSTDTPKSQTNQSHHSSDRVDSIDQNSTRLVVVLDNGDSNIQHNGKRTPEQTQSIRADKKWECAFCTFINCSTKRACEMCGKSRQIGAEVLPLTSGGKECPKCTLVNKRECSTCEACGESLKNSPTYI